MQASVCGCCHIPKLRPGFFSDLCPPQSSYTHAFVLCVPGCCIISDLYLFLFPRCRPQFVMDVDSKEEYFIELILSRHARKLLTARSLRDLGKFSAHLDFNLSSWLARER